MLTRSCTRCLENKAMSEFKSKSIGLKHRKFGVCNSCKNESQRLMRKQNGNSHTKKYEKTKKGFLMRAYRNMKSRVTGVQKKGAHLYLGLELLGKDQFYSWAMKNADFHGLWMEYEISGYDRWKCPSVDRKRTSIGYVIDNMRFITHYDNSIAGLKASTEKRKSGEIVYRKPINRKKPALLIRKVSIENIIGIREKRSLGNTIASIANDYGLSRGQVHNIVTWN